MDERSAFQKALSNFTKDVASGGAIRHLTDLGYSPEEIEGMLDYPTPLSEIRQVVQKYLEEKALPKDEQFEIVKETDSFGRSHFIKKKKED